MIYYKIVEKDGKDYKFLFHGVDRDRKIPEKWIKAEKKLVIDGSGGTEYISGFHVLRTKEQAKEYLQNFEKTKNKVIIPCEVKNVRKKEHSRSEVYLANEILIKPQNNDKFTRTLKRNNLSKVKRKIKRLKKF